MKRHTKIKAGALQFVVFTSVVIAILLAAFVSLTHTYTFFKKQSHTVVNTIKNAEEGVQYALVKNLKMNDTTYIPISGERIANIRVHQRYWGAFEHVTSVSTIKNKTFIKTALTGGQFSLKDRAALYVKDQNKPLILVGNTRIEGTAYLPEKAVRPGNIGGTAYYGSSLIYGSIRKSHGQMPQLAPELPAHFNTLTRQGFDFKGDIVPAPQPGGSLINSFTNPIKYLYSPDNINLSGLKISGHIIIYAENKIVVPATARLRDVVLVAPEIEIQDSVNGSFQAIASKYIHVGKQVSLQYPSALILKGEEYQHIKEEEYQITIKEQSNIKGVVLFWGEEKKNNFSAQVEVSSGAVIYGELYCNQNLKLKGTVHGSVYTSNFIETRLGAVYQNHVFDGTISGNQLPEAYAGLSFKNNNKGVVKWLY